MRYALEREWIRAHARSELWQRAPYSAMRLTATWQGQEYIGLGFAKCRPGDVWSVEDGEQRARGRAEVDLARQLSPDNPFLPMARSIQGIIDVFAGLGKQMVAAFDTAAQESAVRKEQEGVVDVSGKEPGCYKTVSEALAQGANPIILIPSDAPAAQRESEAQDG